MYERDRFLRASLVAIDESPTAPSVIEYRTCCAAIIALSFSACRVVEVGFVRAPANLAARSTEAKASFKQSCEGCWVLMSGPAASAMPQWGIGAAGLALAAATNELIASGLLNA